MRTPTNTFKQALRDRRVQIGFWLALGDAVSAEICAGAGFDWVLIDGEHAPIDLRGVLAQLQAIAGYPNTHAVARVPSDDPVAIKQYLDLGAQTLLVPMIESADEASAVVRACHYPPEGLRGVGGARAARWGRYGSYLREANAEVCVVVQVESRTGLADLDGIAATEGVDGVFIGSADLSASLGFPGQPGHAEVQAATTEAFARIRAAGKAPGILTQDETLARQYLEQGAVFVAVGLDAHLLARQTRALAGRFVSLDPGAQG
jgi:4-hydroxy-2-oxoheptanedioate aldolase